MFSTAKLFHFCIPVAVAATGDNTPGAVPVAAAAAADAAHTRGRLLADPIYLGREHQHDLRPPPYPGGNRGFPLRFADNDPTTTTSASTMAGSTTSPAAPAQLQHDLPRSTSTTTGSEPFPLLRKMSTTCGEPGGRDSDGFVGGAARDFEAFDFSNFSTRTRAGDSAAVAVEELPGRARRNASAYHARMQRDRRRQEFWRGEEVDEAHVDQEGTLAQTRGDYHPGAQIAAHEHEGLYGPSAHSYYGSGRRFQPARHQFSRHYPPQGRSRYEMDAATRRRVIDEPNARFAARTLTDAEKQELLATVEWMGDALHSDCQGEGRGGGRRDFLGRGMATEGNRRSSAAEAPRAGASSGSAAAVSYYPHRHQAQELPPFRSIPFSPPPAAPLSQQSRRRENTVDPPPGLEAFVRLNQPPAEPAAQTAAQTAEVLAAQELSRDPSSDPDTVLGRARLFRALIRQIPGYREGELTERQAGVLLDIAAATTDEMDVDMRDNGRILVKIQTPGFTEETVDVLEWLQCTEGNGEDEDAGINQNFDIHAGEDLVRPVVTPDRIALSPNDIVSILGPHNPDFIIRYPENSGRAGGAPTGEPEHEPPSLLETHLGNIGAASGGLQVYSV